MKPSKSQSAPTSGTATGTTTYFRLRQETTVVLPPNTIEFEWDYKVNDALDLGQFCVKVTNATSTKIDYVLQQQLSNTWVLVDDLHPYSVGWFVLARSFYGETISL